MQEPRKCYICNKVQISNEVWLDIMVTEKIQRLYCSDCTYKVTDVTTGTCLGCSKESVFQPICSLNIASIDEDDMLALKIIPLCSVVCQKRIKSAVKEMVKERDQKLEQICDKCNSHAIPMKVCGRCKSAHYCSVQCQKADWRDHKLMCRKYADMKSKIYNIEQ